MEPPLKSRCVPAIWTPRPIWDGLVPPLMGPGGLPALSVRENWVEKSMRLDLNAVVFALAMLLPIRSSRRALAFMPERPVNRAVVEAMRQDPLRKKDGRTRNRSSTPSRRVRRRGRRLGAHPEQAQERRVGI